MGQLPVFWGNEESGCAWIGWSKSEKSKSLAKALRKMGEETSQGLEGVVKAQLSLEAAKFWRHKASKLDGLSGPHPARQVPE